MSHRNRGGPSARAVLHTNVVLCLFTDKGLSDDHPLRQPKAILAPSFGGSNSNTDLNGQRPLGAGRRTGSRLWLCPVGNERIKARLEAGVR
jgi:hypothetical protein